MKRIQIHADKNCTCGDEIYLPLGLDENFIRQDMFGNHLRILKNSRSSSA